MDMSISSLSINASAINTNSDIGVIMVSKSLESMAIEGEGLRKMLESSVTGIGTNIDVSV